MLGAQPSAQIREAYHEITLHELKLVRKTLLSGVMGGALDLVVVIVQTGDVASGELGDLTSWPTDTTADVEDLHPLFDSNAVCEVVFVPCNGLVKRLAI